MFNKLVGHKLVLLTARVLDHKIGINDSDKPDLPVLPANLALLSLIIRLIVILVNFVTCGFVITSIIHHW